MNKIKIGIIGIGNCASFLLQGIEYYKNKRDSEAIGLMHWDIGGYGPYDIKPVCAFDIDKRKVGKDLSQAIFSKPNCCEIIQDNIPNLEVEVKMGKILDGFPDHMNYHEDKFSFVLSKEKEATKKDIVRELKESGCEILLNYLPVGSEKAVRFYTECALDAKIGFINCMPVFIASNHKWAQKFEESNIPIIGDDIKSQIGATIVHRVLTNVFKNRGVKLDHTYQLNTGGNTDFLNMIDRSRLQSKKTSKTESVQSQLGSKLRLKDEDIHIGPSDWVPWQKDNKICFIRMEGKIFGNIPIDLELRLSVQDSANSAGVVIDAIRCMKLALEREQGGILYGPSSFFMKHPPMQMTDEQAFNLTEDFIEGKAPKQTEFEVREYIKHQM
ncbi:MAG: inositol-3-phosphate synthase [Promethearchaeota archaeon]|nr:MAG: inositol-3-phosphate synthase [Candidatus Lokiarchaeota archaeon]